MRGADSGSWGNICALPAPWVGLLYDEDALDRAEKLASSITHADATNGRVSAAKDGLAGEIAGKTNI